jgi:hypothetical protein
MGLTHNPKIVTNGLVFSYDVRNTKKSWIGRPTTNLLSATTVGINRYNNPGFSGSNINTGQTYKGMPIYELTFIPQDSSFISRLGSGEGFGATHSSIPLLANTRYMSSIYFKSDHPITSFNHTYSNISGWGANSTTSTQYQEDGWTRLYTQYFLNDNGYTSRVITYPNQYGNGTQFTVNTTQTQLINLSVTVPANGSGIPDFAYFYAIVSAAPTILSNGGLTGLSIVDHGLDTTNFTKLSWPSNIITAANLPLTYYFRVSVPSTGGVDTNIRIGSNFAVYTTAITDSKFWKITFDASNISVGQPLRTYWCCPMIEQHDTIYPSTFVNGTRSNTQALIDMTNNSTITANSLTYDTNGSFSFNGTSDFLTIPTTNLGNGNIPWTVSCWIRTTTTVNALGRGSILSNAASGPVYSVMGVNAGKIVYWTYQNSAWTQKLGVGKNVNDGAWHMLTWVNYNNNTMDMYVDGILDSNVPNSTSGNNNPVDRIGGSWVSNGFFAGDIGVLQRYNRALNASEVLRNYDALKGRYGL